MKYVDIVNNDITQTIKANNIRFKSQLENLINVNRRDGFLKDTTTLDQVLDKFNQSNINPVNIGINTKSINNIIDNINNSYLVYEGEPNTIHIFIHNMDTEFFEYNIWILESVGWQNSIVPITIIDKNTVKVELSKAKSCRIILQKITNISKTYNI